MKFPISVLRYCGVKVWAVGDGTRDGSVSIHALGAVQPEEATARVCLPCSLLGRSIRGSFE